MNIKGTARRKPGGWVVESVDGKEYQMVGGDFQPRMEGLSVRIVGLPESDMDAFFGTPKIIVQKLNVL